MHVQAYFDEVKATNHRKRKKVCLAVRCFITPNVLLGGENRVLLAK